MVCSPGGVSGYGSLRSVAAACPAAGASQSPPHPLYGSRDAPTRPQDLGDIFIVSRVEEELTQTCLGIAVIVSVGVLNVILVGRDEEADKEAR